VSGLDQNLIFSGGMQLLILLLAISVHESAHAWMALRCGDDTAAKLGRISLNPVRHIDPVGTLLLPVMLLLARAPVFGWAKPTPVDVRKLRNPQRDHMLVTLAGPVSNLLVAGLMMVGLAIAVRTLGDGARTAAYASLLGDLETASKAPHFPIMFTLVFGAFLNAFLGVFNLIPVPPLDGGQIMLQILPPGVAYRYAAIRPFGFMIVLALAFLDVLKYLVLPIFALLSIIINL
jgi:Zn-dependent protease